MSLIELFITFLQAGGLCIGDGYACISPLRRALVTKNKWISAEDFSRHVAVVQTMPGIFNVNLATYLGKQLCGWKGSMVCLLAMLLPPFVVFFLFAYCYNDVFQSHFWQAFLRGARPAIVAVIALPCIQMWRSSNITLSTIWIPIGAAIAIGLLGVSPSYIILALTILAGLYALFVHNSND